MNTYEWLQTILFFVVLLALVKPLGSFMAKVFQGERTFLSPILTPCEQLIYRISGVKPEDEMGWKRYAGSVLLFNLVLLVSLFVMLMTQHLLPLNPQKVPAFTWQLALNTAVSFVTNTNWQAYVGEQAASYGNGCWLSPMSVIPPAEWSFMTPLMTVTRLQRKTQSVGASGMRCAAASSGARPV